MKRLKICCSILMLCFSMMLFAGCDSKLASIQVIGNTVETNIAYGQTVDLTDFEDLEVLATFEDGTSRVVNYADAEADFEIDFSSIISTTPGEYSVEITYQDVTTTITLTVAPAHITGFVIDRSGISETIGFGLTPNWNNLIVKKVYADDSVSNPHKTALTTLEYSIDTSAYNATTAGEYQIVVAYGAFLTQSFTVEVSSSAVTGIELDLTHVDQTLLYGTALDLENDLVVKAVFDDETTTDLPFGEYEIAYGGFSATTPGNYEITITYNEIFTKYFVITVATAHITGFEVDSSAIPATVAWGTTPTWSGVVVSAVYADNTVSHPHKVVLESTDYSINTATFNPNVAGTYTITVGYNSFTPFTFTVEVLAPVVLGVELTKTNVKTAYLYGEELNLANLVVKILKSDNSLTTLTSEQYTVEEEYSATTPRTYAITIRYSETITASFDVSVAEAHVVALSVDRSAIAASVSYGFVPNWDSIRVYEVYADDSQVEVEDYLIDTSNYSATEIGIHTIYITYGSFSTSFDVNVKTAIGTNNYVIEGETLVIYKGVSYSMGENVTQMSYIKAGTETPVAISGSTFILYEFGNYTFSYLKDLVETTKAIKVVPWISTFGFGESISQFNSSINSDTTNFIATTDNTYKVGTGSYFYFDVLMNSGYLTSEDYITFAFQTKSTLGGTYASVNKADIIISTIESEDYGTGFLFNPESTGLYVKATITPKYNNRAPIVMEFVLTDGVNVFSDAELKLAYGNLEVQNINIHRTIVCTLTANQTNAEDGSPINFTEMNTHLVYDGNDLIANNTGNVYARYSDAMVNDNLTINGNYQTINGSNLPLINTSTHAIAGQKALLSTADGIVNSQIAIFRSEVRASTTIANELTTTLEYNTANNNNITYNNLVIIGNTCVPEDSQGSALFENSGSYSGIRSAYNDVETNNCLIMNTCIGLFIDQIGTDFVVKNTKIYESWANLICGFNSNHLTLTNCQLSNSGGAAVWLEDNDASDADLYNPKFTMDEYTIISNFVAGSEAWFVAYDMATSATGIKSGIEGAVTFCDDTKTILKRTTYEGTPVEKFNFAVVIMEGFASQNATTGVTKSGTFQIGDMLVEENYAAALPISFICSEDGYTPTTEAPTRNIAFRNAVKARIISICIEEQISSTAAFPLALKETYLSFSDYVNPNYIEVVQSVPGYLIHMITTISEVETQS